MSDVISSIGDALSFAFQMAWEVWWALILGFLLSGIVQAWFTRGQTERVLGGRGLGATLKAAGFGAASSSCSYAAIAIAKSVFQKGAGLPAALAFMFASTNLVFELGIVLWIFLGPEFTAAEFAGGLLLILLMWGAVRLFAPAREEEEARRHAIEAQTGHQHTIAASAGGSWRERLTSMQAWSHVAHNFRGDWQMLWKEITAGFLIAGFVGLVPRDVFDAVFLENAPSAMRTVENVLVGPLIAVLSFVCSVGNIPLAAVLWAGGISFAGVIAFIYADLITLPILLVYRKYYGTRFALKLAALMLSTMVIAALAVDLVFSAAGLIPEDRPSIESVTERGIEFNYTAVLNIAFTGVGAALVWLTVRRGFTDPVCGMRVDRYTTEQTSRYREQTVYFCSAGCKESFDADPDRYAGKLRGRLGSRPRVRPT